MDLPVGVGTTSVYSRKVLILKEFIHEKGRSMSPVARDILRKIRSLPPADRLFGAEKLLEILVQDGKLTAAQAHDTLVDLRLVAT